MQIPIDSVHREPLQPWPAAQHGYGFPGCVWRWRYPLCYDFSSACKMLDVYSYPCGCLFLSCLGWYMQLDECWKFVCVPVSLVCEWNFSYVFRIYPFHCYLFCRPCQAPGSMSVIMLFCGFQWGRRKIKTCFWLLYVFSLFKQVVF